MSAGLETSQERLSGWGRTAPTTGQVYRPDDDAGAEKVFAARPDALIARGLGRSYGDAAQCSGGLTVEATGLGGLSPVDAASGTVCVGAGVSLHDLMRAVIPDGWFVPVTPGTRYVSVGGAIAADVHGKNHHRDGSFARHVTELVLATPLGTVTVSPEEDPELFWATAGGMGLTGIVLGATIRLIPIESTWMWVENKPFRRLEDLMTEMEQTDARQRCSGGWLDCVRRRHGDVRSILTRGDHAMAAELPSRLVSRRLEVPADPRLKVPLSPPGWVVNRHSMRAFNEAWFRASGPSHETLKPLAPFFHPLDAVARWNLLYGPHGFVQYQFAVAPDRGDVVEQAVNAISESGVPSFLAVLKRFGPGTPGPLSFAQEGWTLALDFPVGPAALPALLDRLDEHVAAAGGRIYLAKDARLRPELMQVMYPRLDEMAAVRRRVDPDGLLASDLSRRLGISP